MFFKRSWYIWIVLFASVVVHTTVVRADWFISPEVDKSILNVDVAQSINSFLFDYEKSETYFFPKGDCPQSYNKDENLYLLENVNNIGLPKTYIPNNLVDIRYKIGYFSTGSICLTNETAISLYNMSKDMEKEGLKLMAVSGYRSFEWQDSVYKEYSSTLNNNDYDRAAPAGHSEHQLGTAVDIASLSASGVDFAKTPESAWIEKNAYKYGFILSYEEGSEDKTGYMYEPWHLRYVGPVNAKILKQINYTLSYKPVYYENPLINIILGRLRDYIDLKNHTDSSILN